LFEQGIYATPRVRDPILPFDAYHERVAQEMIERVKAITASLIGDA